MADIGSPYVSVIDGVNDSKRNIPVGSPSWGIVFDQLSDKVYVQTDYGTSVISASNDSKIKDIPKGGGSQPLAIPFGPFNMYSKIYAPGSSSVSVINTNSDKPSSHDINGMGI